MTTVAEGVETPEQFEMLANLGCDQSQGYLHSRPLAAADIEPLLQERHWLMASQAPRSNLRHNAARPSAVDKPIDNFLGERVSP